MCGFRLRQSLLSLLLSAPREGLVPTCPLSQPQPVPAWRQNEQTSAWIRKASRKILPIVIGEVADSVALEGLLQERG